MWIVNTEGEWSEGGEMKWTGKTLEIDGDDQRRTWPCCVCGAVWWCHLSCSGSASLPSSPLDNCFIAQQWRVDLAMKCPFLFAWSVEHDLVRRAQVSTRWLAAWPGDMMGWTWVLTVTNCRRLPPSAVRGPWLESYMWDHVWMAGLLQICATGGARL